MDCANCGKPIFEAAPGRWWHQDSQHAWCGFLYCENDRVMPYPIPDDQRARPVEVG